MEKELNTKASELAELTMKFLGNCHEKEERMARYHNLTIAELKCIRQIQRNENINNKEIAERMHLSSSRLTRIMDGLVEKGFILREIDKIDRRNMKLSLSDEGVKLLERINATYLSVHKEILKKLEPQLQADVIKAMSSLMRALEEWLRRK
ncbi:MAG TPA: MarR family transcriptional regulator [Ignavibacteriaceae bacterium]|nr:MarR family transcriptional regulator [Ignavibacteriaceae bacterium]